MKPLGLALLAGLLFALALPPYNQEWLDWFALAPLLLAADGRRPLEAVGLGLIAGLSGGLLHARWHSDSGALLLAYLPFLWLAVFFGVVALAGRSARAHGWTGLPWIAFVACAGVTAEWLTTFSPLPLNVALSQYQDLNVIQVASVTGIWGVSFLLWFVNATLADALLERRLRSQPVGVLGLLLLGVLFYGHDQRIDLAHSTQELRVAAIQDYSPGEAGAVAGVLAETKDTDDDADREAMTRQAARQGAQLIVSSEESLGAAFRPDDPQDGTHTLAHETKAALVVGYSDDHLPRPTTARHWS